MPAKQYEVRRYFRRTDPKTGIDSIFQVGDVYSGPLDDPLLLDDRGPDGRGPLIGEKAAPIAEKPVISSDSTKEK